MVFDRSPQELPANWRSNQSTPGSRLDFPGPVWRHLLNWRQQGCSSQPQPAKAIQTKVRICASFSTIGAHVAFEERFVRLYDRPLKLTKSQTVVTGE